MPIPEELKKRIAATVKDAEEAQELASSIISFAEKAGIDTGDRPVLLARAEARIRRIKKALEGE